MQVLYHYCTASAFVSMIAAKQIWLSSLTLANDSREGKIVHEAFKRIIDREGIDLESSTQISNLLGLYENLFDGLGFCLSEDGDLLSQWRGYAADGQGFSIGFSKEYFDTLAAKQDSEPGAFHLHKVIYDLEAQEGAMMAAFNEIREDVQSGALKPPKYPSLLTSAGDDTAIEKYEQAKAIHREAQLNVGYRLLHSLPNFFSMKNLAFREEQEWRLISLLTKSPKDECMFRASGNRLIPYRRCELKDLGMPVIVEVVIGPKNDTPEFVVEKLLSQNGFNDIAVRKSGATYR